MQGQAGGSTRVYVITGFLGSGKTTFLNRVIRWFPKDRKLMILMNEFGEIGLDGTLIEGEDLEILEISKGSIFCVCVKTDFIRGLHEIAQKIQPDVLIMESTGVANPTDLKRDLALPFFQGRFELVEQFCIVDAVHFMDEYEIFASVEKQIETSTVFILNKIDQASDEQIARTKELIRTNHPDPKFYLTNYADVPLEPFFSAGGADREVPLAASGPLPSAEDLEAAIDRLLEDPDREITPPDRLLSTVYRWNGATRDAFEDLANRLPAGIIRAKGFLALDGRTVLFNRVMKDWTLVDSNLRAGREDLRDRLVLIGPPEAIAELEQLTRQSSDLVRETVTDPMADRGYKC